jgi:hypothetical protein
MTMIIENQLLEHKSLSSFPREIIKIISSLATFSFSENSENSYTSDGFRKQLEVILLLKEKKRMDQTIQQEKCY